MPKYRSSNDDVSRLQHGNDFQVMSLCDEAVHYSPVAKFVDGHYVEGSAGVFLQCTKEDETGFKVKP